MMAFEDPSIRALYVAIGRSGGLAKLALGAHDAELAIDELSPETEREPSTERATGPISSAPETEPAPPPEADEEAPARGADGAPRAASRVDVRGGTPWGACG